MKIFKIRIERLKNRVISSIGKDILKDQS